MCTACQVQFLQDGDGIKYKAHSVIIRCMRKHLILYASLAIVLVCLLAIILYNLPPVHERLSWRVANWQTQVQRFLNPPEEVIFLPQEAKSPQAIETMVKATLDALLPSATPTLPTLPSATPNQPGPTETPIPTATFTPMPTPIPSQALLQGFRYEYQQFNNCGPANLSMALSFWGWQGDQRDTRAFLRPNRDVDDKNVMPEEMVTFVETYTELQALTRVGGDLELLKRLVAAGFPPLIEAGHHPRNDWWMGHYLLINGYDDERRRFTAQDSLVMPDYPLPYEELTARWWRDFNYVYIIIFPPERSAEVAALIGEQIDPQTNYRHAAQKALDEIPLLEGRDLFFAWFNRGSSLVGLQDYAGAAEAYDQAFALYARLPEAQHPYRLLWYQIGPYLAYYHTERYQDVIDLANTTFAWVGKPVLEETFFWRGMAYEASGNLKQAVSDYQKSAGLNPNYLPAHQALERLDMQSP